MSIIEMMWKEPGMDTRNEWLYPKVLWVLYIFAQVLAVLFFLFAMFVAFVTLGEEPAVGILLIIVLPVLFFVGLLYNRFLYEIMILAFRLFESNREMVGQLAEVNESVRRTGETQTRGLQYICDRLAQICDNTEKN